MKGAAPLLPNQGFRHKWANFDNKRLLSFLKSANSKESQIFNRILNSNNYLIFVQTQTYCLLKQLPGNLSQMLFFIKGKEMGGMI